MDLLASKTNRSKSVSHQLHSFGYSLVAAQNEGAIFTFKTESVAAWLGTFSSLVLTSCVFSL
ncbi:hypothetical protein STEG23_029925, partial [Scotinomys teguina]